MYVLTDFRYVIYMRWRTAERELGDEGVGAGRKNCLWRREGWRQETLGWGMGDGTPPPPHIYLLTDEVSCSKVYQFNTCMFQNNMSIALLLPNFVKSKKNQIKYHILSAYNSLKKCFLLTCIHVSQQRTDTESYEFKQLT